MKRVRICFVICWIWLVADLSSAQVSIEDGGVKETKTDFYGNSLTCFERQITCRNQSPVSYVFQYRYIYPALKGEKVEHPLPASVTFPAFPSIVGSIGGTAGLGLKGGAWYVGGFFEVALKPGLNKTLMRKMKVLEEGQRGLVECVWTQETAKVSARFLVFPKDDKLFMDINVRSKIPLEKLSLLFVCIPGNNGYTMSYYDGSFQERDKWICTPTGNFQHHDANDLINPNEGPWVLYFDSKNNAPLGSCALMWVPEQIDSIVVDQKANKTVYTTVTLAKTTRNARFILWNFPDSYKRPADAFSYLKSHGQEWLTQLRQVSFGSKGGNNKKEER